MQPDEFIYGYRITGQLGKGGMASVYLGERGGIKKAIKVLNPFLLGEYPSLRQRFADEARIVTQLNHPNIRRVEYLVATSNSLAMLMDYLEGSDLEAYIGSGHAPVTRLAWFRKVLDAAGYAHAQPNPVVHRDIKPSNIFLTKDGRVLLLDFGIAKVVGEEKNLSHTLTRLGSGTPRYRSPEQVKAAPIDHRSDIYSLGVTLWVLLAGQKIYQDEPNEFNMNLRIVQEPLPVLPNVSGELNGIIAKATAKDPKDRFQSCAEFARALQLKFLCLNLPDPEVRPGPSPENNDVTRLDGAAAEPAAHPPASDRPRRSGWLAWAVRLALLAALLHSCGLGHTASFF